MDIIHLLESYGVVRDIGPIAADPPEIAPTCGAHSSSPEPKVTTPDDL